MFLEFSSSSNELTTVVTSNETGASSNAVVFMTMPFRTDYWPPPEPPPEMTGKLAPLLPKLPVMTGSFAREIPRE